MSRFLFQERVEEMTIDVIVSGLPVSPVDGTGFLGGRSIFTYHTNSAGLLEVTLLGETWDLESSHSSTSVADPLQS